MPEEGKDQERRALYAVDPRIRGDDIDIQVPGQGDFTNTAK